MKPGTKEVRALAITWVAGLALAALAIAPTAAGQEYVCTHGPAAECHGTGGGSSSAKGGAGDPAYGPFYRESTHGILDRAHASNSAPRVAPGQEYVCTQGSAVECHSAAAGPSSESAGR